MRDEYPNILRNQNKYLENNVKTKEVDLYKENTLKRVGGNPGHLNNDSSGRGGGSGGGRGRGGARGRGRGSEHRNGAPQTHGGQGNFGGGNNFQDDNIKDYLWSKINLIK